MAQHRSVPPRLSLPRPPHPFQSQLSTSKTARFYPIFTPTPSNNALKFTPSPTPTPSKRSRAPQGPLWLFTLLHLLSLYLLHQWLSASPLPPPLAIFAFFPLFVAALCLNIIYRPWKARQIHSSQWGLLLVSGFLLGLSYFLRFEGLRSCGPLETIFADFAGSLVVKVLLDSSNKSSETVRKARGLVALLVGIFLLSHGWARVSCSPLAVDVSYRTRIKLINQPEDCVKVWSILAPFLGGVSSALQRIIGAKTALKSIGKKRIQVLSYAMGSVAMFPFALLQLALASEHSPLQYGSAFWSVVSVVAFGMIIAFFGEFYIEEKLFMPVHSLKAFQILTCCVCALELLYGLGISLVGFMFCSLVLSIGVQELALLQGQLSWEELGDTSYRSLVFVSWIRRPLQHIISDKKSRKIAIFLLINTGFMVVEFFYGFLSNSLGLISDACHMLFDCAALAIGLYASYISRLPENAKFNYGYGRFEVVSGYANAVLLVLVASLIVLESIERILEPPEISTESLLVVSVGGLLVNIVGLIFFHEEHHHAHGGGGHSCSHSHSSHKPLHNSHPTSKDTKVDFSSIASGGPSSHDHHQPATTAQDDGNWLATSGAEKGNGNLHELKDHAHTNHPHHHDVHLDAHDVHHDDHEHHDCQGHSSQNGHQHKSYHDHQEHGFEQEGHGHHDHDHQCKDIHQCASDHEHSSHHHHHSCPHQSASEHEHHHDHDHDHSHYHHTSPHQQLHDNQHVCSSGHVHHHSEGHYCESHRHQHNHGNEDEDHDHDHSHEHSHNHVHDDQSDDGHHHMDHNMYGIFLHVLADTLGSVGVVTSTLLIKYKGWLITDPACSIFLSALIIGSVVPLLRNSAEILLQRVPRHKERSFKAAIKRIAELAGVQSVGRAHMWSFTNTEVVGSLHVQLLAGSNRKLIQEKTLRLLHEAGIGDLTLQIEEVS
eukprot:c25009_g2_i3 orf=1368-4184(+)